MTNTYPHSVTPTDSEAVETNEHWDEDLLEASQDEAELREMFENEQRTRVVNNPLEA